MSTKKRKRKPNGSWSTRSKAPQEEKPRAATGRPHVKIDIEIARKLAKIHCPLKEIAAILNVSPTTLKRNPEVMEAIRIGRAAGRPTLRQMQWAAAEKGNVAMMIWLGKQYLGQREPMRIQVGGVPEGDPEAAPIQVQMDTVEALMNNQEAYALVLEAMSRAKLTVQPKATLIKHIESTTRRRNELTTDAAPQAASPS